MMTEKDEEAPTPPAPSRRRRRLWIAGLAVLLE